MSKVVVTGGHGFLGWHLRVRLRALHDQPVEILDRTDVADSGRLQQALSDADTLVHLAGVNRADSDSAVEQENVKLGTVLHDAVLANGRPIHIVYSNSIQAGNSTPYGRGKRRAGELLRMAATKTGSSLADVLLPNLFGEHGRPHYNSFVATFCHELAHGGTPQVIQDRTVRLLHAQRAAAALIDAIQRPETRQVRPESLGCRVSEVLDTLYGFQSVYALGEIPDLPDDFSVDMFNTFRSYMFPQHFPLAANVNRDHRGELFECVRGHGGTGQTFVSTTAPGASRGNHYHLNKVERFFVLAGEAEIALRRVCSDESIRYRVSGADRVFVDMPTLWVHNIRNVGSGELTTLFWADQLHNPSTPDTYLESVELEPETAQ